MRKIVLSLLLNLFACAALAQRHELDSLLQRLQEHMKNDSVQLKLLLDISFDYSTIDPDKGLAYADKAILLAQILDDQSRLASALNYKGVNFESKNIEDSALGYYHRALRIRRETGDSIGVAKVLHNIGIVYFNMSDYPRALDFQQQSLQIFEKNNYKRGIAGDLNSIGVIFLTIADYPKALEYYFNSLTFFEKGNDRVSIAMVSSNIGLIYNHFLQYEKALKFHFDALKIYQQEGNKNGEQQAFGNIGNCYDDMNQPRKALDFYAKGLAIAEEQGFKIGVANSFANMATAYNRLQDYFNAVVQLQRAIGIYKKLGNESGLASAYNQLGNTYRSASSLPGVHSKSEQFEKAIGYFKRALTSAQRTGILDIQGEAWEQLSKTYEDQKIFTKALAAYKNFILIRDSIMNDKRKQDIARLEIQHEYDQKEVLLRTQHEKQQAMASIEVQKQRTVRNSVAAGAILLILSAIIIFVFYKRKRDALQRQKDAEFRAQVTETEIKALRAQMNPHFIFNSLNSISDYISRNDTKAANDYLVKFARIMRLILENSEKKEVSLSDDLHALELYMQLESLRLNNKFSYEIKVSDEIDGDNTLVPPLLLQPFVENSIWHGIATKPGKGRILITIGKENGMIKCEIEDNGIGRIKSGMINDEMNQKQKSFGMKITRERIDILNKVKKSTAGVELSDLSEGTRVELKIPLELSF